MYDTREEANQKLGSTVVLYKEAPVLIRESGGVSGSKGSKLTLHFKYIRNGSLDEAPILDKGWEFRNLGPRVGYLNVDLGNGSYKEATYITRMGVRASHNTQGLSQKNLKIPNLGGSKRLALGPTVLTFQGVVSTPFFADMLEQKYPTMKDISTQFDKSPWLISKAFNRQFAIRRADIGPFYLQYRGKDIGHSDDLERWKIAEQYRYLDETMEYANLKIN
jgi:hypothetical protein